MQDIGAFDLFSPEDLEREQEAIRKLMLEIELVIIRQGYITNIQLHVVIGPKIQLIPSERSKKMKQSTDESQNYYTVKRMEAEFPFVRNHFDINL